MKPTNNSTSLLPQFSHLTRKAKLELRARLQEKQRRRYARDPEYWLFSRQVYTQDEHDETVAAKPFPDKPYIRWMVRQWLETKRNLWPKSRQMMASWIFCALYLHDTQFKSQCGGRRLNFIQSKKQEDSDALLRRCYFIYEHQEPWLKAMYPAEYSYCHLRFFAVGDKE